MSVWPSQTGSRFWSGSTHTECHYPWSSRTHSGLKILERLPQAEREPEGRAPGGGLVYSASKTWFCSLLDLVIL